MNMAFFFTKIVVNLGGVKSNVHTHKDGLSETCRINNMDWRCKMSKKLFFRAGNLNYGSVANTKRRSQYFSISVLGVYLLEQGTIVAQFWEYKENTSCDNNVTSMQRIWIFVCDFQVAVNLENQFVTLLSPLSSLNEK